MSYNGLEWSWVMRMMDYKELYIKLFQATDRAANILIAAQRECEEMYISARETELTVFPGGQADPNENGT